MLSLSLLFRLATKKKEEEKRKQEKSCILLVFVNKQFDYAADARKQTSLSNLERHIYI